MNFESGLGGAGSAATLKWARLAARAGWAGRSRDRELAENCLQLRARAPGRGLRWPRLRFLLRIPGARWSRKLPAPAVRSRLLPRVRTNRATGRVASHR